MPWQGQGCSIVFFGFTVQEPGGDSPSSAKSSIAPELRLHNTELQLPEIREAKFGAKALIFAHPKV